MIKLVNFFWQGSWRVDETNSVSCYTMRTEGNAEFLTFLVPNIPMEQKMHWHSKDHEQDDRSDGKYDLDIEDVTNSSLSCLCLRSTIKSQPNLVRISITKKRARFLFSEETINNEVKVMVIFFCARETGFLGSATISNWIFIWWTWDHSFKIATFFNSITVPSRKCRPGLLQR